MTQEQLIKDVIINSIVAMIDVMHGIECDRALTFLHEELARLIPDGFDYGQIYELLDANESKLRAMIDCANAIQNYHLG